MKVKLTQENIGLFKDIYDTMKDTEYHGVALTTFDRLSKKREGEVIELVHRSDDEENNKYNIDWCDRVLRHPDEMEKPENQPQGYADVVKRLGDFLKPYRIFLLCKGFCNDGNVSLNTLIGGGENKIISDSAKRELIKSKITKVLETIGKDLIQKMVDSDFDIQATLFEKLGHILNKIVRGVTFGLVGYEFSTKENIERNKENIDMLKGGFKQLIQGAQEQQSDRINQSL